MKSKFLSCNSFNHLYQYINSLKSYPLATKMRLNEYNTSTSVYLQQISNHIEIGQGYNQLRKHLFRELHQHETCEGGSEDILSDSIVSHLTAALNKAVNFHRSQQTFRILQIIEDLLTYAEDVMSPAMHNELFVSALVHAANPKIVTFDSKTDNESRSRALGIFWFWFDRYGRDEESKFELFLQGYKELKNKKLQFPNVITIKPSDVYKKQLEKERNPQNGPESNQAKTDRIILQDIEDFTVKTESLFKTNFKSIATTQYVRLIKHKSKTLFEFTSKPNDFKEKEKNLVKDLYKRLRTILKELDKYKQTSLQTKKSQETEKKFIEAKITPKKAPQNQQSLLDDKDPTQNAQITSEKKITPLKGETKTPKKPETIDLLDMVAAPSIPTSQKKIAQKNQTPTGKGINILNADLLSGDPQINQKLQQQQEFVDGVLIDTSDIVTKETKQAKQSRQAAALFQVFSTPKKEVHEEEGGLLAKQASSNSQELSPAFDNENMSKNPYSYIPANLNLTPTSSIEDEQQKVQEKPTFSIFGLFNTKQTQDTKPQTFQEQPQHYDSPHKKGKKVSQETPQKNPALLQKENDNIVEIKDIVNSPNYKPVAPVNYQKYAAFVPISPQKEDEQSKFEFSPKKSGDKSLKEVQFDTPKSGKNIKLQEQ